ncbi:hypothetical protein GCM10007052_20530 [Halioglobus japonicus]|nr:hypothetical protein GCM10007052_20530 [Halioglobus japonicus]
MYVVFDKQNAHGDLTLQKSVYTGYTGNEIDGTAPSWCTTGVSGIGIIAEILLTLKDDIY